MVVAQAAGARRWEPSFDGCGASDGIRGGGVSRRRRNRAPGLRCGQVRPVWSKVLNCGLYVLSGRKRLEPLLVPIPVSCAVFGYTKGCRTASSCSRGPEGGTRGGSARPRKGGCMASVPGCPDSGLCWYFHRRRGTKWTTPSLSDAVLVATA